MRDDAISDLSASLKGYFSMQQKLWINEQPVDMDAILRRFVVRTSRELAKALSKENLNFPVRKLDGDPRDRYSTGIDYEKIDSYFYLSSASNFLCDRSLIQYLAPYPIL